MSETAYNVIAPENGAPVKAWTKGVPLEGAARKQQLLNAAQLPFVFKWIAAMPDVHWGIGATVGSVIPTKGAGNRTVSSSIKLAIKHSFRHRR
jgi:tRNA-splicing ligase RtcB